MSKEDENKPGPEIVGVECYLWCDPPGICGTKEKPMRGWVTAYREGKSQPYWADGVQGVTFTHARPFYLSEPGDMEERPKRLGSTDAEDGDLELGERVEVVGDNDSDWNGRIGVIARLDGDGLPIVAFKEEFDPEVDDLEDLDHDDRTDVRVECLRRLKFVKAEAKPAPKQEAKPEFKVGDRVKSSWRGDLSNEKEGVVRVVRRSDCAVEFENVDFGHNCNGDTPSGNGWYIPHQYLTILTTTTTNRRNPKT